nr:DUF4407 domain-containing protein [Polaribacter sp. IC073]
MLQRFFITCAGIDQNNSYNYSDGEQNKYAGIGATMFFTAVTATIAGNYALFAVFENVYTTILFGLSWG